MGFCSFIVLWWKKSQFLLTLGFGGFFIEGNIHKKYNYGKNTSNNKKPCIDIYKYCFAHCFIFSSSLTASNNNKIAKIKSYVNDAIPSIVVTATKLGLIITRPKAAADKFVHNPDKTLSHEGVNSFFI